MKKPTNKLIKIRSPAFPFWGYAKIQINNLKANNKGKR